MAMSATETQTETEQYVHYHDGGAPGKRRILTGKAAKPTFNSLPRIDMRRMFSEDLADRKELATEVGAACRDVGFFIAVNHGVDQEMLDDTFDAVKKYFDLPTEIKMESHNQKTEKYRGYEAFLEGKLDPSTRGGMFQSLRHRVFGQLMQFRSERRLPHGRRRNRPRAKPPNYASNRKTSESMANGSRSRVLSSRNLPVLQPHV
jgi:isopenicillin N synthase-like dioxygenase